MREAGGRYQGMSGGKWRTGHQAGGTRTRQEEEKEGGQMTGGGGGQRKWEENCSFLHVIFSVQAAEMRR